MRSQNYLSLDLEYNSDGKNGTEDIIQVGIAIGNPQEGVLMSGTMNVKPSNKEVKLHPFITNLTGITQEEYDSTATGWSDVREYIKNLNETYNPFVNPLTWGIGDAYDLKNTMKEEGLDFPYFGRRIIDVKHLFLYIEAANGRAMSGGLRTAMGRHKLEFIGTPHRAVCDAINTMNFYFHLLKRQSVLEQTIKIFKEIK